MIKCLSNGKLTSCATPVKPGLNVAEEVQKIVNLLDKVDSLLKGHVRAKRMAVLTSPLVPVNVQVKSSYRGVTVDILSEGLNRALAVEGKKVFFFVKTESVAPLWQGCSILFLRQTCLSIRVSRSRSVFEESGCVAKLRTSGEKDEPFLTDNVNYIVDLYFKKSIGDLKAASDAVLQLAGVVEHGMFLDMATTIIVIAFISSQFQNVQSRNSKLQRKIECFPCYY
ncbi:uncharacterized protein LOC113866084 [Abrus precatorius]|uniref:Uncharacterized protein LOC113866084 n=1 Tax=Abrus precatorius TaxID=3816 RepID=A0A8B8LK59_ABRPR|nr:uncharacterized protein LOC113866084 [Abrus precatorius]